MIATFFGWIIAKAMSIAGSGIVQKAIEVYNGNQDRAVKIAQIDAGTGAILVGAEVRKAEISAELQSAKLNWPVFWVIICVMIGAPAFTLWSITIYDVCCHVKGIWPQDWNIAEYPESVAPWVEMSIEWLYNPVGVPGTIMSAWFAGKVTGR